MHITISDKVLFALIFLQHFRSKKIFENARHPLFPNNDESVEILDLNPTVGAIKGTNGTSLI